MTNNSSDYLLLGQIDIPNIPGGQVNVTGGATVPSGITLVQNTDPANPSVSIKQDGTDSDVGDAGFGAALFLTGPISNLGGTVSIYNAQGSYGQLSTIDSEQLTINIPNGLGAIDTPDKAYPSSSGKEEETEWNTDMIWPGGNPYSSSYNGGSPLQAIPYIVNALYNSDGSLTTSTLNSDLYGGTVGDSGDSGSTVPGSIVFIGDSFPYVTSGDSSVGTNEAWSYDAGYTGSATGSTYEVASANTGAYFPTIPSLTLTQTIATSAASTEPVPPPDPSIFGGGLAINALSIDLNGEIDVGQAGTNWSVDLPAALTSVLNAYEQAFDAGTQLDPVYNIPEADLATVQTGDSQITATYNAQTNQITVNDVVAALTGGNASLTGEIISTNPQALIKFEDGIGKITVNNQTGIPVVVQNIDSGSAASTSLDITDTTPTLFGKSATQSLYVYQPDKPIQIYTGASGATLGTGTSTPVSGTSTTYNPLSGLRWNWTDTASLTRKLNVATFNNSSFATDSPSEQDDWLTDWSWSNTSSDPWTLSLATDPITQDPSLENSALKESITASSTATASGLPTSIPNASKSIPGALPRSIIPRWSPTTRTNTRVTVSAITTSGQIATTSIIGPISGRFRAH